MPDPIYMGDTASTDPAPPAYGLTAVAGYVAGYVSYPALVKRFYPEHNIFSITPNVDHVAECLDVERGDATPAQAGPWVRRMLAQGVYRPCIYANASTMPAVHLSLVGIPREHYRLWVAQWDGGHEVPAGYDAKQFYGTMTGSWDYSVVVPGFFRAARRASKGRRGRTTGVHPKVTAAGLASALSTAVLGVLHGAGLVHLTPAEVSAVTGGCALIAGYAAPRQSE